MFNYYHYYCHIVLNSVQARVLDAASVLLSISLRALKNSKNGYEAEKLYVKM